MDKLQRGTGRDGAEGPQSSARPKAVRRLALPAVALSVALGAAQVAGAVSSQAATTGTAGRAVIGHTPVLPKGAVSAAAPSGSTKLSLDIELNSGRSAALQSYAAGVGDKNSPYYHRYMTPSEVADNFGASTAQVSAVEAQLKSEGLTVNSVSSDRLFVSASATVSQAQSAFGVRIAGYTAAGRTFYANTSAPTVPGAIAGDVSQIVGLDDVAYEVPLDTVSKHAVKADTSAELAAGVSPNYSVNSCSDISEIFSGSGLVNGNGYYTADAISNIYGFSPELAAGNDGAGVTVAVVEFENYDPTGVADLDSCYGHKTSVSEQKIDGGPTTPANFFTGAQGVGVESALDIENIANLAPGVKIVDYAGKDGATVTDSQVLDVYNAIFSQDSAQVVSDSWGTCEALLQGSDSAMQSAENTLFEQAAVQGQSVVAASGDNGSTSCYGEATNGADDSTLSVDDPSDQPFVLAAGGTAMTGLNNPTPSVWNNSNLTENAPGTGASGGGVSTTFALPSYQNNAAVTGANGYTATCPTAGTTGCRAVPDVSALADPSDGYMVEGYGSDPADGFPAGEYFSPIGGTSGAAPVWAAVLAIADATTTCRLNGNAGFANPSLYTAGEGSSASSVFTDVTSGSNWVPGNGGSDFYNAGTGYDLATGWGTPKVGGVVASVCQTPIVSPASYFVPDGPDRLLDTRPDAAHHVGPITGPIGAGATISLPIGSNAENDGVPASNVTAVVVNVTAVAPTVAGSATVYPDGNALPTVSNLNWSAGKTIPNLVVVPVKDGKIDIFNFSTGTVNYLVDLEGYFTSDTTAANISSYTPVTPVRVVDTRSTSQIGTVVGPLAQGSTTPLQIAGQQGIPAAADITSVVLNVTVVKPTANSGNIIVYPAGGTQPSTSNVNFTVGESIPNLVIVPLSSTGAIDIYNNSTGSIQYLVDVQGYFSAGTSGAKYHPLGPVRLIDTRIGQGETSVTALGSEASQSAATLSLALPSTYSAVIANLTVVKPQAASGDLDAFPAGGKLPIVSNVNFTAGEVIPNLAFISSNNGVSLYNHSAGSTNTLLDLAGYFSAN